MAKSPSNDPSATSEGFAFAKAMPGAFEIPQEMRELAEKSLAHARESVSRVLATASEAVETMEHKTEDTQKQAWEFGRRGFAYAEQSLVAAFELAERLLKTSRPEEIVQLQTEFAKAQFEGLRAHLQESGATIQRQATETLEEMAQEGGKLRDKARQAMEQGAETIRKAAAPKG
ncbi:phasin family protein [Rhabdaerophilum calidifontis]|uniref:phasin family protein n=1 Tax=Rhabdaerophilum calidifontis TaxID=2604328 RepID=UPI0014073026|nr:phasin family protein [Rhabdaerophilum calidifontis]